MWKKTRLNIENNKLVPWNLTVYLARRRNLLGESQANRITSGAGPIIPLLY